ncbi:DUF4381 domain-containing protein [Dyella solisilvae]|uniref:DUF4381 domain-containing protein n=1 Tax=Dyella solisilvae TaxID=1920168 RepID=A0A370K734_9GAMM|nr:DUF4381 domain-containing protein [Dyella solisilvae]RDI98455.1 DUF4381 domain-containing protein [Dyella solisilvae]
MTAPANTSTTPGLVLRDIHLPPSPSWWPPAPGWWILAALIVVMVLACAWLWRRKRLRNREEQALLAELDALAERWQGQTSRLAASIHQLLRRGALRFDVSAGQHQGEAWRRTLAQAPVAPDIVDRLAALELAMYRADAPLDTEATIAAARQWLKQAWRISPGRARSSVPTQTPAQEHGDA